MAPALGFALAVLAAMVMAGPVAAMLSPALTAKNYRGEVIPTAMGMVLLLAVLAALGLLTALGWMEQDGFVLTAFWLTLVSLAGLVDDAAGNHGSRGFRGHFAALFRGRLTTGMVKVLLISGGSLALISWPLVWISVVELGVLVLAVNLFNQLDLRPGRALKSFLIIGGILALGGNVPAAVGSGGALALLGGDLRARFMLGDTGANLLGAILGLALVSALSQSALVAALILLALGNALGELFSFSRLIAGNRVLLWLDQLGRQAGE